MIYSVRIAAVGIPELASGWGNIKFITYSVFNSCFFELPSKAETIKEESTKMQFHVGQIEEEYLRSTASLVFWWVFWLLLFCFNVYFVW